MDIKQSATNRGFTIIEFSDFNNAKCSLQKSSIATSDNIWLGVVDADPRVLVRGEGWMPLQLPDEALLTTRMHLSREQVIQLLPILQRFAETGEVSI